METVTRVSWKTVYLREAVRGKFLDNSVFIFRLNNQKCSEKIRDKESIVVGK